jgi:hypothetical protein
VLASRDSNKPDMFGGKNVEDWLEEAEKNIQDHIQAEASLSNDSPDAPRLREVPSSLPPLPSGFKLNKNKAPLESKWDMGDSLNINLGGNIPSGNDLGRPSSMQS